MADTPAPLTSYIASSESNIRYYWGFETILEGTTIPGRNIVLAQDIIVTIEGSATEGFIASCFDLGEEGYGKSWYEAKADLLTLLVDSRDWYRRHQKRLCDYDKALLGKIEAVLEVTS